MDSACNQRFQNSPIPAAAPDLSNERREKTVEERSTRVMRRGLLSGGIVTLAQEFYCVHGVNGCGSRFTLGVTADTGCSRCANPVDWGHVTGGEPMKTARMPIRVVLY